MSSLIRSNCNDFDRLHVFVNCLRLTGYKKYSLKEEFEKNLKDLEIDIEGVTFKSEITEKDTEKDSLFTLGIGTSSKKTFDSFSPQDQISPGRAKKFLKLKITAVVTISNNNLKPIIASLEFPAVVYLLDEFQLLVAGIENFCILGGKSGLEEMIKGKDAELYCQESLNMRFSLFAEKMLNHSE